MKKILGIVSLVIGLGLAGCDVNPNLIRSQLKVILPPQDLVDCPVKNLPARFNSNKDVAEYLVRTYGNNVKCHNSIKAIMKYLNIEKSIIENNQ